MRALNKNKQTQYYSLQDGKVPVYETDEDGNIIYYTDSEGNRFPLETGETTVGYSKPVQFKANISNSLTESKWQDYGVDRSTNFAQIVVSKGTLPLKEGSVIWKKSEIGYKDEAETIVDDATADYVVKGVADEGLYEDLYLLQKIVK